MKRPLIRPIGTPPSEINITGYFMPCIGQQPIFMNLSGTKDMFLPVFSTKNKLRETMIMAKASFETIAQINDPMEFLDSIREARRRGQPIRIMADPFVTAERGTTRFKEVLL